MFILKDVRDRKVHFEKYLISNIYGTFLPSSVISRLLHRPISTAARTASGFLPVTSNRPAPPRLAQDVFPGQLTRVFCRGAICDTLIRMSPVDNPVLKRLRSTLDATYGARIERVVLYGSRARGDARPDSDYDVAVFLKDFDSFSLEAGRIAEIETDILYDTGAVINAMPFKAGAYQERTGLMQEVRREGVDL